MKLHILMLKHDSLTINTTEKKQFSEIICSIGHVKRKSKGHFFSVIFSSKILKTRQIPNFRIWREQQLVYFCEDKHPDSIFAVGESIFF